MTDKNEKKLDYRNTKDRKVIKDFYMKLIENNQEIYMLGGELNPSFYESILEKEFASIQGKSINIICGPYISVKDKFFREYFNLHNDALENWWYAKKKDEWWKAHPVFKKASQENNIRVYIIKQRHNPHFLIGANNNDILIEEPHEELKEKKVTIYFGNKNLVEEYLKIWNRIKEEKCYEWNKKSVVRLFKPFYVIKEEQKIEQKLTKEFKGVELLTV